MTSILQEKKKLDQNKEQNHILELDRLNDLKIKQENNFNLKLKEMEKRLKDASDKEFD